MARIILFWLCAALAVLCAAVLVRAAAWRQPGTTAVLEQSGYSHAAGTLRSADPEDFLPRGGETRLEYAARVARLVHGHTYHCGYEDPQFFLGRYLAQGEYGYLDPEYFLCGFCHQSNYVLFTKIRDTLDGAGLRNLNGHAVATFREGGREYALDAYFGAGPIALDWDDPGKLRADVAREYAGLPNPATLDVLLAAYLRPEDDSLYDTGLLDRLAARHRRAREIAAWAVFAAPGAGLALFAFLAMRLRRGKSGRP